MVPSLRFLCLKKVISEGDDYQDLPKKLVKDIDLMKLFNGSYCRDYRRGDYDRTEIITVFYDGKSWALKSCSWSHKPEEEGEEEVCFCERCHETTGSNPISVSVREGETVPAGSTIRDFFGIPPEKEDLEVTDWTFQVYIPSNDDWVEAPPSEEEGDGEIMCKGEIRFTGRGTRGTVVCRRFEVVIHEHEPLWLFDDDKRRYLHFDTEPFSRYDKYDDIRYAIPSYHVR